MMRYNSRNRKLRPKNRRPKPKSLKHQFLTAASQGNVRTIEKYLKNPLVKANGYGNLALCQAAKGGHLEMVKVLMKHGADPKDGRAIKGAAQNNHRDMVLFLVDNGAEVKDISQHLRDKFTKVIEQHKQQKIAEQKKHERAERDARQRNNHHNIRHFLKRNKYK